MQPLNAKDLSNIRDEYDRISKTIARFGFVRATIIAIGGFALASGLNEISSSKPNEIVDQLKKTFQLTQVLPDFKDTFLNAVYGASFQKSEAQKGADNAPEETKPAVSDQQKSEAQKKQDELVAQLKENSDKAFTLTFNAPLLGTKMDVDLRVWGFVLPVVAILSETYLAILRYKRRLIFTIGGLLVRRDLTNASSWDIIQFSQTNNRPAAFMRHPTQYEAAIAWIGAIALVWYLANSGSVFWASWESLTKITLVGLYVFIAIYALAYVTYVRRKLRSQVLPFRGLRRPQPLVSSVAEYWERWVCKFLKRIPARFNLVSGSLFIICTLWLLVAKGCQTQSTGFQYLQHDPEGWLCGPLYIFGAENIVHRRIIWVFYAVGLLLASLSLIIAWRFQKLNKRQKLASGLRDVAAIICMFFVTDLCFGDLFDDLWSAEYWHWPMLLLVVPVLPLFLVPIIAWIRYRDARCRLKRRSVLRWYHPQIAIAIVFCLVTLGTDTKPLVGVPVFVAGMGLIASAYAAFARRAKPLAEVAASPNGSQG